MINVFAFSITSCNIDFNIFNIFNTFQIGMFYVYAHI